MGKGIKTRVAEKGIKSIDKAAVASEPDEGGVYPHQG